jgi:tetratricopeptide (TPR) repeat protein
MLRVQKLYLITIALLLTNGCASYYRFLSQPNEAQVYVINGGQKTVLGQTPIDFTKAALPSDVPFVISFEKAGFENKEITVTPSENSLTTVSVNLKQSLSGNSDANTKRIRNAIQAIFEIQELTAQKRYVDALAKLKSLESEEPSLAEVFILRGSLYVLLNDRAQAKKEWEQALKLDPTMETLKVKLLRLTGGNTP